MPDACAATAIDDRRERWLIVGAGFCGLGIAAALGRHHIAYDMVEADDAIGGNWYHGVYDTVHIISSRKTTQYSDLPMPDSWPDFPSKDQMLEYLQTYADHWGLREHLELSTSVETAEPDDAGAADETWRVVLRTGDATVERRYRGVIVAIGHHWSKRFPDYPGDFTGETIHSKDYKSPEQLRGKRVLVIGGGNSACDIAVEAARFAVSSHISMRRGYWFLPKTMFGIPSVELLKSWMPVWAQRKFIRAMLAIIVGDYQRYGLQIPDHQIFEKHPTINSELLYFIKHGRIVPHVDIARWDGSEVEFVDGTRERVDLVVCATGYHQSYPFLPEGSIPVVNGVPQLYAGLFRPQWRHLVVFGTGQPRYGAGPLITEGAESLAVMLETLPKLTRPVGALLKRMGEKPPKTIVQDPHALLRKARFGRRVVKVLPRVQRWLPS